MTHLVLLLVENLLDIGEDGDHLLGVEKAGGPRLPLVLQFTWSV